MVASRVLVLLARLAGVPYVVRFASLCAGAATTATTADDGARPVGSSSFIHNNVDSSNVRRRHLSKPRGGNGDSGGEEAVAAAVCRVAVCLSGHIRSFVHPAVHRSIRRNLVEAIEEDGCEVDVFAYATRGDTVASLKQGVNSEFTPDTADVERALTFLAPTELVWHQEQAGILPNSCPAEQASSGDRAESTGGDDIGRAWKHWWQRYSEEASRNLYWQLYKSLAAYRLALKEEERRGKGFKYDWIVRARFDVAWARPIPSLQAFSREAVWFGAHYWPMSDHFALVPRALADGFFSAVTAFYACDDSSWPPPVSWWQPGCHGMGFEESVLFRHIHASGLPYRYYAMFEYVVTRGASGGVCDVGGSVHTPACNVLGLSGALQEPFSISDCIAALEEWHSLRCRVLFPSGGMHDAGGVDAVVDHDYRAWERLVRNPSPEAMLRTEKAGAPGNDVPPPLTKVPVMADLDRVRSRLTALRDAVLVLPASGTDDEELRADRAGEKDPREHDWSDGFDAIPPYWAFSPNGCPISQPQYPGRAPHLVMYYTLGASLRKELAQAVKCFIHLLVEGGETVTSGASFDWSLCAGVRPLEQVMIDVSWHIEELGVCTADGSLGLSAVDHIERFFGDPTEHCVGYGSLTLADDLVRAQDSMLSSPTTN